MIIENNEANNILNNKNNLLNKLMKNNELKKVERKENWEENNIHLPHIPMDVKATAAVLTRTGYKATEVAEKLNLTYAQVAQIKRGDVELPEQWIEKELQVIRQKALNKLNITLDSITEEKIQKVNAVAQSQIAKNLTSVMMTGIEQKKDLSNDNSQVIVYAPQVKTENHYQIIEA